MERPSKTCKDWGEFETAQPSQNTRKLKQSTTYFHANLEQSTLFMAELSSFPKNGTLHAPGYLEWLWERTEQGQTLVVL